MTAVPPERDAVASAWPDREAPGSVPPAPPLPGGYTLRRAHWAPAPATNEAREQEHENQGAGAGTGGTGGAAASALRPLTVDVLAAGVGPAAAAAGTATALTAAAVAGQPYGLAVSAGIGGGFAPVAAPVATVVASTIVAADLGAQTAAGFVPVTQLGFGTTAHHPPPALVRAAAGATGAVTGPVLTVSTVTGSAEHARTLAARCPGAAAEAMEGFGVAEAAAAHGLPVLEVRTVSNAVGPRDRAAWRIPEAMRALGGAFAALVPVLRAWDA